MNKLGSTSISFNISAVFSFSVVSRFQFGAHTVLVFSGYR
jgi:hypothetical protein